MKTLKITLALVAVLVLTVSGVQSDNVVNDEPTYETKTEYNIIVHGKEKLKKGSNA